MAVAAVWAIAERALFAASLLVFAFGIRRSGSVTARRPLGTAALTALAGWTLGAPLLDSVFLSGSSLDPGSTLGFGYAAALVAFLLALTAVTQIGRAGAVPAPWNWAPTWTLVAVALVELPQQFPVIGAQPEDAAVQILINLNILVRTGATIFLGVLAIVLANRPIRPRTVPVYPRSEE